MFQKIQQLIDDKDALVFVLIDEVKNKNVFILTFNYIFSLDVLLNSVKKNVLPW